DYLFDKLKLSEQDRARFRSLASLRRLSDPTLTPRQRSLLVQDLAAGVDNLLKTVKDPAELLSLNRQLIETGTRGPLNIMEYWPVNPRTQAQARPIAQAVDKIYLRAIQLADQQSKEIEARITPQNQE